MTNDFNHDYDIRNFNALDIPQHNLSLHKANQVYVGNKFYNKLPNYINTTKQFKNNLYDFLIHHSWDCLHSWIANRLLDEIADHPSKCRTLSIGN